MSFRTPQPCHSELPTFVIPNEVRNLLFAATTPSASRTVFI